ncbi:MAG: DNA/RNA nuclease SfsA [Planctomycetes bacterium]|nr:DNA/RNA nuclease SfsA [Planctomycetota bacterium]
MSIIKLNLPTLEGTLLARRNRFLADIRLADGALVTAMCANTGSMKSCVELGRKVIISDSENESRKYRYTWEMIHMGESWVNVNTGISNSCVEQFLHADAVADLDGYSFIRREVKYGREGRSRIDLLLTNNPPPKKRKRDPEPEARCKPNRKPDCYVEVKNTSMRAGEHSVFPDSVSERGQKHLEEMMWLVREQGLRAAMIYFCGRTDTGAFRPADEIDARYGKLLREAVKAGVEVYPLQVEFTPRQIKLVKQLPLELA